MILPLRETLVYLITNRASFRRESNPGNSEYHPDSSAEAQLEALERAARAGCQLIQIREKDLGARALARFTRQAIARARPHGARVLVNDRLDVALATEADGVHLRTTSLSIGTTRQAAIRRGRPDLLIGISTHSMAEARLAEREGADFIVCGPVFETRSGRREGPVKSPMELGQLAEVCQKIRIPVIALGGIDQNNFQVALEAGAAGIAGIALFQQLTTLERTIARLRAGVDRVICPSPYPQEES
ncbi:MAG: thiamine phosphate synthase [Acidobacteriota bacterium]